MTKNYIAYTRVSTKKQGADGNGITSQKEIVRRFVEQQDGNLMMEFSEVESGRKTDTERPQLLEALNQCRRHQATLVIAKLDRLARNAEFLLKLQNSGVPFTCCDCPNADRFTVGILALLAQRERELISERTRLGMLAAKSKGVKFGPTDADRSVKLMVAANRKKKSEFAAQILPVIQEIKSAGVTTLREIAQCLNRRGIQTRTGKTWYPMTVRNVLLAA